LTKGSLVPHRGKEAGGTTIGPENLDRVLPLMDDPAERDYFERLRRLARLALS
jgi:hypothetical protein